MSESIHLTEPSAPGTSISSEPNILSTIPNNMALKSNIMVTNKPVAVTVATGFIAGHLIQQLLERGYTVRGTVRSKKDSKKYDHLMNLKHAQERLTLHEANLVEDGSFDECVNGCEMVMHTASPYTLDTKDPQKELVDPAIQGTITLLKSAMKFGVKRVILTSSVAAVTDSPDPNKVYTEKDWNVESSLNRNPYYYSKVMAEKSAWSFLKDHDYPFELAVINPCVVIGPSLTPEVNQSNKILQGFFTGEFPGLVHLGWAFVDVRDVALSHILAMESPTVSGQNTDDLQSVARYLCASDTKTMQQVRDILEKNFPDMKNRLPSVNLQCKLGDFLIHSSSYLLSKGTGQYMRTNLGKLAFLDNSKIKKELSINFRSAESSIVDTIHDLIKWGHLKK